MIRVVDYAFVPSLLCLCTLELSDRTPSHGLFLLSGISTAVEYYCFSIFQPEYLAGLHSVVFIGNLYTLSVFLCLVYQRPSIPALFSFYFLLTSILIHFSFTFFKNCLLFLWQALFATNNKKAIFSDFFSENPDEFVTVTFGSCAHQRFDRLFSLNAMFQNEPNTKVRVFCGDNIYRDRIPKKCGCCDARDEVLKTTKESRVYCCQFCAMISTGLYQKTLLDFDNEYDILLSHPDFKHNDEVLSLATWDDHDYGDDNAGKDFPEKHLSKRSFLKFLGRLDAGNYLAAQIKEVGGDEDEKGGVEERDRGIYYDYDYIDEDSNIFIKFMMLDSRWNRVEKVDILGSDQEAWIRSKLKESWNASGLPPDWIVFCLSSSLLQASKSESKNCPFKNRQFFFDLFRELNVSSKVLFLTGDVHYSAVYCLDGVYEFCDSSFTHTIPWYRPSCFYMKPKLDHDGHRVTAQCGFNGYGKLMLAKHSWKYVHKDSWGRVFIPVGFQKAN